MKYISVSLEVTGQNHEVCQVIEFAAVADDLKLQLPLESLPTFQTYILHPVYVGEPAALAMHADIFRKIANWNKLEINVCSPEDLMPKFHTFLTTLCGYNHSSKTHFDWMEGQIKINVAGKNFGNFDSKFLEKIPNYGLQIKFSHRILDPAMLYFNPETDSELPNTETCMKRAGIDGEVKHTALEDALNVVRLLRKKYTRK